MVPSSANTTQRKVPTISGTLLRNTCGVAALAIMLLGVFWIAREYKRFQTTAQETRETELIKRKTHLQHIVRDLIEEMSFVRPDIERQAREEMRFRVNEAVAFTSHIVRYFEKTHGKEELCEIVRESLRPFRFDEGRGYFFAADMEGVQHLFTIHPELEGRNLLKQGDARSADVLRRLIAVARERGEGFVSYKWEKPGEEGLHAKTSYVKVLEPMGWLIGAGFYEDDIEQRACARALEKARNRDIEDDSHILVGQFDGQMLVGPGAGSNQWDLTDADGVKVVQEMIGEARFGGGAISYRISPTEGLEPEERLSYVRAVPQWGWYVGASVRVEDIHKSYLAARMELRKRLLGDIGSILAILIALLILSYLLATGTSQRLEASFLVFTEFFRHAADEKVEIDENLVRFDELRRLARYANRMAQDMRREHEALAESESLLAQAEELAKLGTFRYYPDDRTVVWSDQMYRIHGLEMGAPLPPPESLSDVTPQADADIIARKMQEARETGAPMELEYHIRRTDDEMRTLGAVIAWTRPRSRREKGCFVGAVQDITQRKRTEQQMARLAVAIEQAAEDIVLTDPNGVIEYVNPAFENITGFSREEALGQTPAILKSGRHDESFYRDLWSTITSGNIWRGRITNRKKDGDLVDVEAAISPIFDTEGNITGYVSVKRDVTQEIQMENQLRQAQKMEAIGTLAGGIAHDFNNILSGIMGYTEMALMDLSEDSMVRDHLTNVMGAGERAASLVRQILTFSRQGEQEKRPLRFQSVLKEAMKLMRGSLPSTIRIVERIDSDCPPVMADPTQLHQMVMNLCTNAYHAMRDNGVPEEREKVLDVGLSLQKVEEGHITETTSLNPGTYVRLSVGDTGHGMDRATRERIFDPYFTTKEKGQGTGLGLATVLSIVQEHGGGVGVYSELNQGTVFNVYIPVCEGMSGNEARKEPESEQTVRGSERILFVDDEPSLVSLGRTALERFGYSVTALADPVEALKAFASSPNAFDAIITDFTMPRLTGVELARQVRDIRSTVPILMCTGFSEALTEDHALRAGIQAVIMKPIVGIKLAAALRHELDARKE